MWVGVHETSKRIRYRPCLLYSPILLDSQEANANSFSKGTTVPAGGGAEDLYYPTLVSCSRPMEMENGVGTPRQLPRQQGTLVTLHYTGG